MGQGQQMNAVRKFLINQLVGKSGDAALPDGRGKEREPIRLALNGFLRRPVRVQEITGQLWSLALIIFGSGSKFNIGFAMENQRLHSTAA